LYDKRKSNRYKMKELQEVCKPSSMENA